jgi:hypothetical protein
MIRLIERCVTLLRLDGDADVAHRVTVGGMRKEDEILTLFSDYDKIMMVYFILSKKEAFSMKGRNILSLLLSVILLTGVLASPAGVSAAQSDSAAVASSGTTGDCTWKLENGTLTVHAAKNLENEKTDKAGKIIRQERFSGAMQRSFYVGEALTEEDIGAKFENGVLSLNIPKKDAQKVPEKKQILIEG